MKKTQSSIYHDRIALEYESKYSSPYWELYDEITWNSMKRYLPRRKGAIVLDAGGGTGHWSRELAKRGYMVVCSDLSERMLQVARKKAEKEKLDGSIEFVQADITDLSCFEDRTFDMVIAQGDPVGYCDNPGKAVRELSRVARKGAYVCVSIDGFYSTLSQLLTAKDYKKIDRLVKTHITEFHGSFPVHNFTVGELKTLFRKNGLEVKEIIGKPVITFDISRDRLNKMLSDKAFYKRILKLELKFNSEPSLVGLSTHIEAIGRKT
jgi:ubiquinone/menaquinone biosynthesis C-methylase UbiE